MSKNKVAEKKVLQDMCIISKNLIGVNPIPVNILLEITGQCNQKCSYCLAWKRRNKELSENKILEFVDEISKYPLINVALTGGEPSIKLDLLLQCYNLLHKRRINVSLITNGFMNDITRRRILEANWDWLQVSMDSPFMIENDRVRGVDGAWVSEIHTIYGSVVANNNTYLKIIITPQNKHLIPIFIALGIILGVSKIIFDYVAKWNENKLEVLDENESKKCIELLDKIYSKVKYLIDINYPTFVKEILTLNCKTSSGSVVVLSNGDMRVPYLPKTFGNIIDSNFMDIWSKMYNWNSQDNIEKLIMQMDVSKNDVYQLEKELLNKKEEIISYTDKNKDNRSIDNDYISDDIIAVMKDLLKKDEYKQHVIPLIINQKYKINSINIRMLGNNLIVQVVHVEEGNSSNDRCYKLDSLQSKILNFCYNNYSIKEMLDDLGLTEENIDSLINIILIIKSFLRKELIIHENIC